MTANRMVGSESSSFSRHRRRLARGKVVVTAIALLLALQEPAQAYIGPGAGFAVLSSFLVVFVAILSAFFTLLTWPIRWVFRAIRGRKAFRRARIKRLVILGLDGMSPKLVDEYMA
ncbi:MAG: hypothetical protein ACYS7M_13385, partial [Planctomycetota bacterium]